jgi:uncharacterized protein YbaR (Trm112 family)
VEKKNLSHMQKEKKSKKDLCPVCEEDLYYDEEYTRRIGIYDYSPDIVYAWMCPYCRATFDKKNNLLYIKDMDSIQGKA